MNSPAPYTGRGAAPELPRSVCLRGIRGHLSRGCSDQRRESDFLTVLLMTPVLCTPPSRTLLKPCITPSPTCSAGHLASCTLPSEGWGHLQGSKGTGHRVCLHVCLMRPRPCSPSSVGPPSSQTQQTQAVTSQVAVPSRRPRVLPGVRFGSTEDVRAVREVDRCGLLCARLPLRGDPGKW